MKLARLALNIVLIIVAVGSAGADWQKVRITHANGTDWPPAPIPESFEGYFHSWRLDSLAYDPIRHVLVLFKGRRTFEYDGQKWTLMDAGSLGGPGHLDSDFPLWAPQLIYYPKLQGIFLYGGSTDYIDAYGPSGTAYSWIWNGTEWILPPDTDITHRPQFGSQAGTYDPITGTIVMFGGLVADGNPQKGTYIYDGMTWKRVATGKPGVRIRAAMSFDELRQVIVLYGGYQEPFGEELKIAADTWEWDGNSWKRVSREGPGPRAGHSLVYLPNLKRVVLFGGYSAAPRDPKKGIRVPVPHNDLWSWDGKSWTRLPHTRPAPNPRYGHGATYDSDRHQMVIYGGEDGTKSFRDLWYYRAEK